jgi:hypothetical protein
LKETIDKNTVKYFKQRINDVLMSEPAKIFALISSIEPLRRVQALPNT